MGVPGRLLFSILGAAGRLMSLLPVFALLLGCAGSSSDMELERPEGVRCSGLGAARLIFPRKSEGDLDLSRPEGDRSLPLDLSEPFGTFKKFPLA